MSGRPWYAFYPDVYERAAGTLSFVQDSAYRRMLDQYYKSGGPLPLDKTEIYRACRAMARDERKAIDANLDRFFTLEADGYHQKRADLELQKAETLSAKRSEAASKRYSKPETNDGANELQLQEQLHTQSTATATSSEAKASSVSRSPKPKPDSDFPSFYAAFPLKKAKAAAHRAYDRALNRAYAATLLAGAVRYAQERRNEDPKFTKHPATWLNQDCWLDENVSHETSNGGRNGAASSSNRGSAPGLASFGATVSRAVDARSRGGLFGEEPENPGGAAGDGDPEGLVIEGRLAGPTANAA